MAREDWFASQTAGGAMPTLAGHPAIHSVAVANPAECELVTSSAGIDIVAELLQLSGIDTKLAAVGSRTRNASSAIASAAKPGAASRRVTTNAGRPQSSTS